MNEGREKREILHVAEVDDAVYFLEISYVEGDAASDTGHVFVTRGQREEGEVPVQVLATNDSLRTLWVSPAGFLWVGSADGSVGTTATVRWAAPTSGADYVGTGPSRPWSATDLPRVRSTGLPPNVTALWGTSDSDVYAGIYGGHIYRWDGNSWTQVFEGPADGNGTIGAFGGVPNDIYAVGQNATILHFDGDTWQPIYAPEPQNGNEAFTGVHPTAEGQVLISASGKEGRLLHGTAAGLVELGRYPIRLIDMAALDDRILFATGDGVAELIGSDVQMIKSNFMTVSMSAGKGRLFFIEPVPEVPRYIEYKPSQENAPWFRITYSF